MSRLLLLLLMASAARADGFAEDLEYGDDTLARLLVKSRGGDEASLRASAAVLANAGHESHKAAAQVLAALRECRDVPRARLTAALGRMGPRAVPALVAALHLDDGRVRLAAALALADVGTSAEPGLDALLNVISQTAGEAPPRVACLAAWYAAAGRPPTGPNLGWLAANSPRHALRLGGRRPALIDTAALSGRLPELLAAPDDERRRAARLLAVLGGDAGPLVKCLAVPSARVRLEAIEGLGEMGSAAAVPALGDVVRKGSAAARAAACRALGRIGSADGLDALRFGLRAGDDGAEEAALALAKLGPLAAPAAGDLREALGSTSGARLALARIGKAAVPTLIEMLKGDDEFLRGQAVRAIREMGAAGEGAVAAVEAARAEAKGRLDVDAFAAYEAMGAAGVEPLAKAGIAGSGEALDALGRLGPLAAPAWGRLNVAMKAADFAQRRAILRALGNMGPKASLGEWPEILLRPKALDALAAIGSDTKEARAYADKALSSPHAADRLAALRYLAAVGGSADALADDDPAARVLSAELLLLAGKGDAVGARVEAWLRDAPDVPALRLAAHGVVKAAALRAILDAPDATHRVLAAHALLRIAPKDEDAVKALRAVLEDARERAAVRPLFAVIAGARGLAPDLVPLLSPKVPLAVRVQAAEALGAMGADGAKAAPEMLRVLAAVGVDIEETGLLIEDLAAGRVEGQFEVGGTSALVDAESLALFARPLVGLREKREGAADDVRVPLASVRADLEGRVIAALVRLGEPGLAAAAAGLESQRTHLRRAAALVMLAAGDGAKAHRDALRVNLGDADALTAARCATVLARLGGREALPALLRCLTEDGPAAAQALEGLAALGDGGSLPAVASAGRRLEAAVRAAAVRAMGRADLARPYLRDRSADVRVEACRIVMKADKAFDPLRILADALADAPEMALGLIVSLGDAARPLAGRVREAVVTGRPSVAIAAARALHRIRGDVVLPRERLTALLERDDLRAPLRLEALRGLRELGGKERLVLSRLLHGPLPAGELRDAVVKAME